MKLHRALPTLLGALTLALSCATHAQEATRIKFTLDWKIQGVHAPFYRAAAKGYFKAENLDVVIDQGEGSAAAVTRVLSGAYQAGFGDVNAIIQMAGARQADAPVMVYMVYNRAPFVLLTKASGPIKSLKDTEGRAIGSPPGSASVKLFPALAKKNGVDEKKVSWVNVAPNLQEQLLIRGEFDAAAVFSATSYMNLVAMNQDPDKDYRWLFYNDYGLDLYSNGVLVSARLAKENPKAVAGLVRAINRAMVECAAQPDSCVEEVARVEPLLNKDIERRRLSYVLKSLVLTPETAELGLGDIKDSRMSSAISQVAEAYGLARAPAVAEVFNRSFLPPQGERMAR